jgi:DNA repair exonuclease SbcCD ATPase subunit
MLTPTRLTVRGFRGFTGEQTFEFDSPVTILFGGNHYGKSSTLNALEWCLFGDKCKGADTKIRERVRWKIENRHLEHPGVMVELRLADADGECVVRRQYLPAKEGAAKNELELECPDGQSVSGSAAEQLLARWLRSSFRDFSTTVYQHQETIRGIVTQEPSERNDAIDRLLGLSDYRNLLSGIATRPDPNQRQGAITTKFGAFEGRVTTAVTLVERQLEESRREAEKLGVLPTRLTEPTALEIASQVMEDLQRFSQQLNLPPPPLGHVTRRQDLPAFESSVQSAIDRLRGSMPGQDEQTALYQRETAVIAKIDDYEKLRRRKDDFAQEVRQLDSNHGSQQRVERRMAEIDESLQELNSKEKEVSGRHHILVAALDYLQESETGQINRCPVCDTETEGLLVVLRNKLETTLQGKLEGIRKATAALRAERIVLEDPAKKYNKLNEEFAGLLDKKQQLAKDVGKLFKRDLTLQDDPVALLKGEQEQLDRRLRQLQDLIRGRQERLTQIQGELNKLRRVREALQQADKQKIIERIKESEEYRQLNEERDRLALFVNDVEAIKAAIKVASHEEASQKLDPARGAIDKFFRQLTGNTAVQEIKVELKQDARTGRNAYDITDGDGQNLTPILSQGDLTALALAMLLGLASAAGQTAPFGFVMLDDPSQSLGAEHKGNLATVLDEVCKTRQLLLATMDAEFRACLDKRLTKAKTEYIFEGWTPSAGPRVLRK